MATSASTCRLVVRRHKLKSRKKPKRRKVEVPRPQPSGDTEEYEHEMWLWEHEPQYRWRYEEYAPGRRGVYVADPEPLTVKPFSPRGWLEATRAASGRLQADIRQTGRRSGRWYDTPDVQYSVTLECPEAAPLDMAVCAPDEIGDSGIFTPVCSVPKVGRRTIQTASTTPIAARHRRRRTRYQIPRT